VVITVRDDGRGLDPQRIFRRAVDRGLVPADAQLSEAEMQRLILAPGFSTAEQVSDISGRGVGMDVVASTIQALGGELALDSVVGQGLTVTLRLPLTLAIIDGQLVRFGGRTWALPLGAIVECVRAEPTALDVMLGRGLVYVYGDETLPVLDPCAGLGLQGGPSSGRLVMILEAHGERVALLVDEVMARQQIVVKSLEQHLRAVPGLSGATVLGDGSIAFILDVDGLRRACPVAHPRRVGAATQGALA
jgi:two-component system chemotaxis sensor kinase CheA